MARLTRLVLQTIGFLTVLALVIGIPASLGLGSWLQYQNEPKRADFIFPLAGNGHRLIKAAELYKQGFAPKILLSNERIRPPGRLEQITVEIGYPKIDPVEFRMRVLEHLDVPHSATESFGKDLASTAEEAEAIKHFFGNQSATVLLVTSPYQARRAKFIFEREVPQIQWLIVWPTEGQLPRRWWGDQDSAIMTIIEVAKLLHYLVGGVFRGPTALSN